MITINISKLQEAISGYKTYFPSHIVDEIYKWKAVKHFQDYWDNEATDFVAMFMEATALFDNLLTTANHFPRGMVKVMCETEPETVREMFRDLYNESEPLAERVNRFKSESDRIRMQYWPEKMHYQDINSISTYLWARYPSKYYIYKYSEIKATTQKLESSYKVRKGADADSLSQAIEFFDLLRTEIQKDPVIRPMLDEALTSDCYNDDSLNCLIVDFDFYVSRYFGVSSPAQSDPKIRYWLYSPGENGRLWDEFYADGVMGIGWDELGNLKQYQNDDEIVTAIEENYGGGGSHKNDKCAINDFVNGIQNGDVIIVKQGRHKLLGRGVVASDYYYDDSKAEYRNRRKVDWTINGEWDVDNDLAMKTLTDITQYNGYPQKLEKIMGHNNRTGISYYWLNANPTMWNVDDFEIGEIQTYTAYNEYGNKRAVFSCFESVKPGDLAICYASYPRSKTKAIIEFTQGLHQDEREGLCISFTIKERFPVELSKDDLLKDERLSGMSVKKHSQGSLFSITKEEFDIISKLARDENTTTIVEPVEKYSDADFLSKVYISSDTLSSMKHLLERKKNIILQGAPGVGKTYCARRLCYAMMQEKDDSRIAFVQFHQNYSYEDFIMGYKPFEDTFKLREGIFYSFCQRAKEDPNRDYFFIIDEINRGNLSKVFGELLMLIEYRNESATLAYTGEEFRVPSNVYLIGLMNTADRSLAMIDYALRRRFSFIEMKPCFEVKTFIDYQNSLNNEHFNAIINKVKELNVDIRKELGDGFEIGHSYFCELTKEKCNDNLLKEIIDFDILPTLKEYWFDNPKAVETWEKEFKVIFND